MTDYTELIRQLKTYEDGYGLYDAAAAAIEELQAEVDALKHDIERYVQINTELLNEPLQVGKAGNKYTLNEPKRGKWKKNSHREDGTSDYECSVCLGIMLDVPDDDEHPLVAYCPMCGAKMEVQDGQ